MNDDKKKVICYIKKEVKNDGFMWFGVLPILPVVS